MGFCTDTIKRTTRIMRGDKSEEALLPLLKRNDKVKIIVRIECPFVGGDLISTGHEGTVIVETGIMGLVGVSFNGFTGGHNLDGKLKNLSGCWVSPKDLVLLK